VQKEWEYFCSSFKKQLGMMVWKGKKEDAITLAESVCSISENQLARTKTLHNK